MVNGSFILRFISRFKNISTARRLLLAKIAACKDYVDKRCTKKQEYPSARISTAICKASSHRTPAISTRKRPPTVGKKGAAPMFDKTSDFPKVTVILRGYTYEQCRCVVSQLPGTRLAAVEVAMNTPGAAETIARLVDEFGNEVRVGAGTVTTPERARAAAQAGSRFMLSPICFTPEIFAIAREAGAVTVPAAFSPTEIRTMFDQGADIVKVFPAARLGARYLTDVQAPLDWMPLMVVGGVNAANVQEFFDAGATYAGIGSGIFDKDDIRAMNADALAAQVKAFEESVRW